MIMSFGRRDLKQKIGQRDNITQKKFSKKKNKVPKHSRDLSFNNAMPFFEPKYLSQKYQKGTHGLFFTNDKRGHI